MEVTVEEDIPCEIADTRGFGGLAEEGEVAVEVSEDVDVLDVGGSLREGV